MKNIWQLFAAAALVFTVSACGDDNHGHAHGENGEHMTEEAHDHGDGEHSHDQQAQPQTEAIYSDEHTEAADKKSETHKHEDGEEHTHH